MASVSKTYPVINELGNHHHHHDLQRRMQNNNNNNNEPSNSSKVITTTTTTVSTTTKLHQDKAEAGGGGYVAKVEDLGRQATTIAGRGGPPIPPQRNSSKAPATTATSDDETDGNSRVCTISTLAAQSGQSRIVLAVLKDGLSVRLKVQEMRPTIFEVGANLGECVRYCDEHEKLARNLARQRDAPIGAWWRKYNERVAGQDMSAERKLVYMCMAENLQGCWRALLMQLEERSRLLAGAREFYESAEQVARALDKADQHVQVFRRDLLSGASGSHNFAQAYGELKRLNELALDRYVAARRRQQSLVEAIGVVGTQNLGDSRVNLLISDARELINYVSGYLEPLERRRLQLESVTKTTSSSSSYFSASDPQKDQKSTTTVATEANQSSKLTSGGVLREIANFNDLDLVDSWLSVKIEQLNSTLLSSLGACVSDSRQILSKHEQVALECRAIEEASLMFRGKNIHAIKSLESASGKATTQEDKLAGALFERQKALAQRTRDVISILEARIVLLRRTIDFYLRSIEATNDVNRMLRRLQVDNSLQSVQFVSNELELKDVSSVVASGATIINELQQLQLAQQHGQRSRLVSLQLVTTGIRLIIDQLSQDLAHLKTVLSQRKMVLLNEDTAKMASNFAGKCHQLQLWLSQHLKRFLATNNLIGRQPVERVRALSEGHEQLRLAVQGKTLEVEALLRSLPTLKDTFDDSKMSSEIQRSTDELRRDWIEATSCLDRRAELIRKYLAILDAVSALASELDSLESFPSQATPVDGEEEEARTDEEIRANIEQSLGRLHALASNFKLDLQKAGDSTELAAGSHGGGDAANDIDKREMAAHADELVAGLADRKQRAPGAASGSAAESPAGGRPEAQRPAAHQRPQQADPPRFTRVLADQSAEPFSSVELECETDQPAEVDWFMNNFKKIPPSIRHSAASEPGNRLHRLTISSFSPVCCGTYVARATTGAGQAVSQCRVRLLGIKEVTELPAAPSISLWRQQHTESGGQNFQTSSSPAVSTTSSFSQWRPHQQQDTTTSTVTTTTTTNDNKTTTISRLISQSASESPNPPTAAVAPKVSQATSDSDNSEALCLLEDKRRLPVTQATYSGPQAAAAAAGSKLAAPQQYTVESPTTVSSSTLNSRSVSKSPLEGSPQPPVFVRGLADTLPRSCSRAGLVCLVIGNPPPTIEWMHNNQTIATTKCPRARGPPAGSICKLTIETMNPHTQGQYVCRAANRAGQTSTGLTLSK